MYEALVCILISGVGVVLGLWWDYIGEELQWDTYPMFRRVF